MGNRETADTYCRCNLTFGYRPEQQTSIGRQLPVVLFFPQSGSLVPVCYNADEQEEKIYVPETLLSKSTY